MSTEKTLIILNASALKESSCRLRLYNLVVEGYTGKVSNNDVEWGSAFHRFREIFRDKGMPGMSEGVHKASKYFNDTPMICKEKKSYLTTSYLQEACITYATKYEKDNIEVLRDSNGKGLLEVTFCFPYKIFDDIEIAIAGTIDELGKVKGGANVIVDCKTTSSWEPKLFFHGFLLSPQLRNYSWAVYRHAQVYPDSQIAKFYNEGHGCIIDGVFHNGQAKGTIFHRSDIIVFKEKEYLEFESILDRQIEKLVEDIRFFKNTGELPLREGIVNGACHSQYGLCKFYSACASPDVYTMKLMLEQFFVKKFYNPLEQQQ